MPRVLAVRNINLVVVDYCGGGGVVVGLRPDRVLWVGVEFPELFAAVRAVACTKCVEDAHLQEGRSLSQVCEALLGGGLETCRKEGP